MNRDAIRLKVRSKELGNIPTKDFIHADFDHDFGVTTTNILIIFSTPRSGSTLLCEILYRNSICLAHEYLQGKHYLPILARRWDCFEQATRRAVTLDKQKYIDRLLKYRTLENGWLGINLHGEHIENFLKLENRMPGVRFHYLHILRANTIEQAVSYEIASQTGQWSKHFEPLRKANYNYYRILHKLYRINRQNSQINAYLNARVPKSQTILYEDILTEPENTLRKIPFLHIPTKFEVDTSLKKQSGELNKLWVEKFSRNYLGKSTGRKL